MSHEWQFSDNTQTPSSRGRICLGVCCQRCKTRRDVYVLGNCTPEEAEAMALEDLEHNKASIGPCRPKEDSL